MNLYFKWVTEDYLQDISTTKNGLRKSIPKKSTKIQKYIIRMIQFYSGVNNCMPITAEWDLEDYCKENNIPYDRKDTYNVKKELDDVIFNWCVSKKYINGLKRWSKVLT